MVRFKNKKLTTFLLIASIALLFCLSIPVLRKPSVDILEFPLKIFNSIAQEFKALIFYHRNYIENKKLNKEIGSLKQEIIRLREIYLENERLKKLLSLKKNSVQNLVAARVIGRDPSYWTSVVILDKGKKDNIKLNLPIITPAGLAGKIIEVGNSTSKAMLLNDPNFAISAIVQRSRQEGLVSGTLENRLIMRYLPRESDIKSQDIIVTSGLTETFPKGIVIGVVSEIRKEFSGLSLYCLIKPAVDFAKLEEVLIIIK